MCVLTSPGQVPARIFSVFFVPDGSAHRADQGHDQQDAKQDQDLHVCHPLHVRALQWRFGGVLGGQLIQVRNTKALITDTLRRCNGPLAEHFCLTDFIRHTQLQT